MSEDQKKISSEKREGTRRDFYTHERNKSTTKKVVTFAWCSNNTFHYMFKAEFVQRDFKTYESNNFSFKHVMEHVVKIPRKYHNFFSYICYARKFKSRVGLSASLSLHFCLPVLSQDDFRRLLLLLLQKRNNNRSFAKHTQPPKKIWSHFTPLEDKQEEWGEKSHSGVCYSKVFTKLIKFANCLSLLQSVYTYAKSRDNLTLT